MEEADTEERMRARVRASGWSLPLAGASATCYSLYGKSPSRDVDDRQNISSTSRARPAVFSPHWWQVCLGQVCSKAMQPRHHLSFKSMGDWAHAASRPLGALLYAG